jgi:hypothetical protein
MDLPDIKKLSKLARACRQAGIASFKCTDFEFTLTDDLPEPKTPRKTSLDAQNASPSDSIDTDGLTDEQKLFWSVQDLPELSNEGLS